MKQTPMLPLPSRQYMRDFRWIESHVDRLSRDHPNRWIAVHHGRIVATGKQLGRVKAAFRKKLGEKEIPVYFVDDGTIIL
jgi:hypothetical protein